MFYNALRKKGKAEGIAEEDVPVRFRATPSARRAAEMYGSDADDSCNSQWHERAHLA
jgi:hypothetical protein